MAAAIVEQCNSIGIFKQHKYMDAVHKSCIRIDCGMQPSCPALKQTKTGQVIRENLTLSMRERAGIVVNVTSFANTQIDGAPFCEHLKIDADADSAIPQIHVLRRTAHLPMQPFGSSSCPTGHFDKKDFTRHSSVLYRSSITLSNISQKHLCPHVRL